MNDVDDWENVERFKKMEWAARNDYRLAVLMEANVIYWTVAVKEYKRIYRVTVLCSIDYYSEDSEQSIVAIIDKQ